MNVPAFLEDSLGNAHVHRRRLPVHAFLFKNGPPAPSEIFKLCHEINSSISAFKTHTCSAMAFGK